MTDKNDKKDETVQSQEIDAARLDDAALDQVAGGGRLFGDVTGTGIKDGTSNVRDGMSN